MAYKNQSLMDAGYFYCPYIPRTYIEVDDEQETTQRTDESEIPIGPSPDGSPELYAERPICDGGEESYEASDEEA